MIYVLISSISGFFSGMGMGGGTILIFLLTFVMGINQFVAQATNLIFFVPTSIVAIWVNIKNKNVDLKLFSIISIFGIIGAIVGANVATLIKVDNLKTIFGIFLLIVAGHEIYIIIKEYIKTKKET
ncbi:MAG: sulfite exporter TauE/SafE family protein [Clostridia bacterium]|nr:sulfite exporter TauE/SafE family protein [Clostridia bacterium]